jgi:hypothetical protein
MGVVIKEKNCSNEAIEAEAKTLTIKFEEQGFIYHVEFRFIRRSNNLASYSLS